MSVIPSLLDSLLQEQREALDYFFDSLDSQQVQKVLELCLKCRGSLILSGMGKSGIIAEKIAKTLLSTGIKSFYLPAADLLHGDLGALDEEDLLILLSKSGRTQEILTLIPHVQKRGTILVAVVSDPESPLVQCADATVILPVVRELCPFDLVPTISTTVQLLFGDLLVVGLMREKGIRLEEYARNHPSGFIGKRTNFTVRELMRTGDRIPICGPKDRLVDQIVTLSNKKCGCLLICSTDLVLMGIFTDGDLRRALQNQGTLVLERPIEELMTQNPITLTPQELAHTALQKMKSSRKVTVAPVLEEGKVIGLLHIHDIL